MNLQDSLFVIENFLGIETDSLLPFAEADTIGGYNADASKAKWHMGSLWEVEGQTLYALIRALRPDVVVELGSLYGCSTSHMAAAVRENGVGTFTAVDVAAQGDINAIEGVKAVRADAFEWLEGQPDNSIDFIFEDLNHTVQDCYRIGVLAQQKLAPGGVLVAHDAAHFAVGAEIREGYTKAGLQYRVYLAEPSDCGLLVWREAVPVNLYLPKGYVAVEAKRPYITQMEYTEDGGMTWKQEQTIADSLADTEPALQAQEDKPKRKRKPARKAVK